MNNAPTTNELIQALRAAERAAADARDVARAAETHAHFAKEAHAKADAAVATLRVLVQASYKAGVGGAA